METVEVWVARFLKAHGARYQPSGWPPLGSDDYLEMLEDWTEAFQAVKVTEDEATRASRRMAVNPPQYNQRRDHLPAIMATIATMRAERSPASGEIMDRAQAEYASRDCEHCGGSGFAPVWHPNIREASPGKPHRFNCECVCPYGRLIRRGQMKANERYKGVDFADVLRGSTGWRLWPPNPETREADERAAINEVFGAAGGQQCPF